MSTFNPVQQALRDSRGIRAANCSRFRFATCWSCQEDKERVKGTETLTQKGFGTGAPRKFVCMDCQAARAARKAALTLITTTQEIP